MGAAWHQPRTPPQQRRAVWMRAGTPPAQPNIGVHARKSHHRQGNCSVPSGPRDARAAAHTHAAYFVRSCLPHCDHSCPTTHRPHACSALALRWAHHPGWNSRGKQQRHDNASPLGKDQAHARSLTPKPRIPRGVRVERSTGGKRSPHRPLVATLDGSFHRAATAQPSRGAVES